MPAQQVCGKIIGPLDPAISNMQAPLNRAIHAVVGVLGLVVAVEGLLGREGAGPGAIGCQAGEFARGAGVGAAGGQVSVVYLMQVKYKGGGGGNLLPEHLGFSQNVRLGSAREFLVGFTGAGAGGLAGSASWCPKLAISGLSVVILGPRTEYQPSSSG